MPISQKEFFEDLGAPLVNARWSWGSVRHDGIVFLRVWQHLAEKQHDSLCVPIAWEKEDEGGKGSSGYKERMKHFALIKNGAPCFLVMCQVNDDSEKTWKVKDFDRENVFRGGRLFNLEGNWWIEIGPRVSVRDVAAGKV
jgi:hypothetical protein